MISITPIAAFDDNYFWLLSQDNKAVIVDPGDAEPVIDYLNKHQLTLTGILITHHHHDHVGGLKTLKDRYNCPVWGPKNDPVEFLDTQCSHGETIQVKSLGLDLKILEVGGHTHGHIAYFAAKNAVINNSLFCGDTVFSAGCGRLFEGTAKQMWQSMQKILTLPEDTLIYPAHEYTLSNIKFALKVEPENKALKKHQQKVVKLREQNRPSLPTNLSTEMAINPFLRVTQASVIQAAKHYLTAQPELIPAQDDTQSLNPSQVFAIIRQWKDVS